MAAHLNPYHSLGPIVAPHHKHRLLRIRIGTGVFLVFLIISGLTAFPLEWLAGLGTNFLSWTGWQHPLVDWLHQVEAGIIATNADYPFIAYGTDWLAFAHIVIGVVFIGPLIDPVRNIWVFQFGMIACAMVLPLALIAGPIREIPLLWRFGDCLFGILGFIPLWLVYRETRLLEKLQSPQSFTA